MGEGMGSLVRQKDFTNSFSFELTHACQDPGVDIVLKNILEFNQIIIFESFSRIRHTWVVDLELNQNLEATG